jgi:hypothetical protein
MAYAFECAPGGKRARSSEIYEQTRSARYQLLLFLRRRVRRLDSNSQLGCVRTIVPELSGSELFGHERGAFTGAHSARDGAFALADGAAQIRSLFLGRIIPSAIRASEFNRSPWQHSPPFSVPMAC